MLPQRSRYRRWHKIVTTRLYVRRVQHQWYHQPDGLKFRIREIGKYTLQPSPANIAGVFFGLENKASLIVLFSVFVPDKLRQNLTEEDNAPVCHQPENSMDTCSISIGRDERRHAWERSGALYSKMAAGLAEKLMHDNLDA